MYLKVSRDAISVCRLEERNRYEPRKRKQPTWTATYISKPLCIIVGI